MYVSLGLPSITWIKVESFEIHKFIISRFKINELIKLDQFRQPNDPLYHVFCQQREQSFTMANISFSIFTITKLPLMSSPKFGSSEDLIHLFLIEQQEERRRGVKLQEMN